MLCCHPCVYDSWPGVSWGDVVNLRLGSRKEGRGSLGWAGPLFYVFSHPSTHLIPTRLSEVGIITPISQMGKQIRRGRMTSSRSSGWYMEAWEMSAGARPRPEEQRHQIVARSVLPLRVQTAAPSLPPPPPPPVPAPQPGRRCLAARSGAGEEARPLWGVWVQGGRV